jgi:hypothetical protein
MAFGKAIFTGIGGTVTVAGVAQYLEPKSASIKPTAQTTEAKNGQSELVGFDVRDKRLTCQLELVALADTNAHQLEALSASVDLVKVTLSGFPANSGTDHILLNGDWIAKPGDISVSISDGEAKVSMDLMRPLTSPLTIDELLTAVI